MHVGIKAESNSSVGTANSIWLIIEMLLNPGSIPKQVMCCRVTKRFSIIGAK